MIFHNIAHQFKTRLLEISGFSTGATAATIKMAPFITSVSQAAAIALITGFIGAFGGYLFRLLIQYIERHRQKNNP